MNAYTTRGRARIRPRDIAAATGAYPFAAASLAALERQRGCQADAEMAWLLKQHGVTPNASASHSSLLRRAIGAALARPRRRTTRGPLR